jgi:hypothetical protein
LPTVDQDVLRLSIFNLTAYGETIPNNILAGENNIIAAMIDHILISVKFFCKADIRGCFIKIIIQINIAASKIIEDKFLKLGLLSAILPPR